MISHSIHRSSVAAIVLVSASYAGFYLFGWPLLTEILAEWIMAHTPNTYAVALLDTLGDWAKPFAATGGLAIIGFVLFLLHLAWQRLRPAPPPPSPSRRAFFGEASRLVVPIVMAGGTAAVAMESWSRDRRLAAKAAKPTPLWEFRYPTERDSFAPGLVRPAVTLNENFYGMSKNTVDPAIDPTAWRLLVTVDGKPWKSYTYQQLRTLRGFVRYTTMRCVSNTLRSNLMGTAEWFGITFRQLIDPASVPSSIVEAAFIGADGHDDSLTLDHFFSQDVFLALGMNGQTLSRLHGFPVRLIAPRYYGFKSVKWLSEIRLTTRAYFGTWPKMGYTKEPVVHTMSYIDRVRPERDRILVGGVSFAGLRGVSRVQVRAGASEWVDCDLEQPMSPYTWTRWKSSIAASGASIVEARALDGHGHWQATRESPIFPDGVKGPTIRKLS
jgi:DMSO/TMAO reductase YedYZ molybdopterin-dependent catalytic subunit